MIIEPVDINKSFYKVVWAVCWLKKKVYWSSGDGRQNGGAFVLP